MSESTVQEASAGEQQTEVVFQISRDECQRMIRGVCPSCGGVLEPIETVDNGNQPTHWAGCLKCETFSWGIEPRIYRTAHKLVTEHGQRAYSEPEPADPRMKDYWLGNQVSGIARLLATALRIYDEDKP